MENNLFTNLEPTVKQEKDQSFYDKILESRLRPDIKEIQFTETKEFMTTEAGASTPEFVPQPQKSYTQAEVLAASTEYFKGDNMAANVWMNKYALKDSIGNVFELTPDDMHRWLAKEIARVEQKYPNPLSEQEIYDVLKDFKYIIPQGSPMAGIGNDKQVSSLSNCFVIGNEGPSDSYGGIMKIDQEQVQLMKRRGGVGHDLSHIRPTGSKVDNTALTSTGIVPFMERYSNSTREVAQDGRRGALMLSISVKHPDAERFIDAKLELGKVTGANVSVRISDEFMHAVMHNKMFKQQYPIDSTNPTFVRETNALDLWNKIIHNAWASAEPGILFWDTIIRESIPDSYADLGFKTLSTNPCGEIPLCAYDSCRLLAINLYSYVDEPYTENATFNVELFTKHSRMAQRIMDDIVDLEIEKVDAIIKKIDSDPEVIEVKGVELRLWENIRKKALQGRRTGIGITAEGDMLAALGTRYGSDEAISFSTGVHQVLALEVYRSSVEMAGERGAFEVYDAEREKDNPFIGRIRESAPQLYDKMVKTGRRNISMLTIAPTGSVSICTQTTSGIEPVFAVSYKRRRKVNPNDKNVTITFVDEVGDAWEEYNVFHPKFEVWLKTKGYDVAKVKAYTDQNLREVIVASPYHQASSADIDWLSKVKMQGNIQKWVDHSISVTVNVPSEATENLVSQIYKTAWESGCKGITIYREGSRSGVLISNDEKKSKDAQNEEFNETQAPPRPKRLEADIIRFQNNYEKWIAVVGKINNKPYEIFTGKSDDFFLPPYVENGWIIREKNKNDKARYDFQFQDKQGYNVTIEGLSRSFNKEYWNYAKLISGILRHGMPLPYAIELIQNLTLDEENINTWKNGVVRGLKRYIPDGTQAQGKKCPECGDQNSLIYQDGCLTCNSCGYSKCS